VASTKNVVPAGRSPATTSTTGLVGVAIGVSSQGGGCRVDRWLRFWRRSCRQSWSRRRPTRRRPGETERERPSTATTAPAAMIVRRRFTRAVRGSPQALPSSPGPHARRALRPRREPRSEIGVDGAAEAVGGVPSVRRSARRADSVPAEVLAAPRVTIPRPWATRRAPMSATSGAAACVDPNGTGHPGVGPFPLGRSYDKRWQDRAKYTRPPPRARDIAERLVVIRCGFANGREQLRVVKPDVSSMLRLRRICSTTSDRTAPSTLRPQYGHSRPTAPTRQLREDSQLEVSIAATSRSSRRATSEPEASPSRR
jgi:hypothetical protein